MRKIINLFENVLVTICVIFMTLLVFSQVLARILFGWSSPAIEESARFLMLWSVFIGAARASRKDSHIRLGYRIKGYISIWLDLFSKIITFLFLCFFTFLSYDYVTKSIKYEMTSIVLNIPLVLVHSCFLISGLLMGIHTLLHLYNNIVALHQLKNRKRGSE